MASIPDLTWTWRIQNLSAAGIGQSIKSESFAFDFLGGTRWTLHVNPTWENASGPVQVCLSRGHHGKRPIVNAICELSLVTAEGAPHLIGKCLVSVQEGHQCKFETHNWPTHGEVFVTNRSRFLPDDTLTVRCRLWDPDGGVEQPLYRSSVSRIVTRKHRTILKFQNISSLEIGEKKTIEVFSDIFDHYNPLKSELFLSRTSDRETVINVNIHIGNGGFTSFDQAQLSVVDRSGRLAMTGRTDLQPARRRKLPLFCRWEFTNFIQRQILMDKRDGYLPNDVLSLHFQLSTSFPRHCENEVSSYNPATLIDADDDTSSRTPLQGDLLSLYKDGALADFTLLAENKSFPVHKTVLGARSPVFRALFSSGMKEASSSVQDIPDMDADTVDRMLHFLYTDTVQDPQWENLINLYYAADKYQILPLKRKCFSILRDNVNASNVREILELAERHSDEGLKSAVDEFLQNHDDEPVA